MHFFASSLSLSLIVTFSLVLSASGPAFHGQPVNGQSQVPEEDSVFPADTELAPSEREKLLTSLNATLKAAGVQPAAVRLESGEVFGGFGITLAVVLDEPRTQSGAMCRGQARLYVPDNDASGELVWKDYTTALRSKGELHYAVLSRTQKSCRGPFDPAEVTVVVGAATDADLNGAVAAIRHAKVNKFFAINRYNRVAQDNAISSLHFFDHEGQRVAKAITIAKSGKKQLLYLGLDGATWIVDATDAILDGY